MTNPHLKQVPVQVLIDKEDHIIVEEKEKKLSDLSTNKMIKGDDHSEGTISEESSFRNSNSTSNQEPNESERRVAGNSVRYPFYTMQSRKKEKKKIRAKVNKIVSRVHNTDCLLKKIKAKYLKYLFLTIKEETSNIDTRKFDQCVEVRNLNIHHNRNNFLNLTISELLIKNKVMTLLDIKSIEKQNNLTLNDLLRKKVKFHYQFDFLNSKYYQNWIKDPIKIYQNININGKGKKSNVNKNCLKYPNHSKKISSKITLNTTIFI